MSKPAARLGDIGSDHNGFPPTPIISGSPDVIINGKPAARVGDALAPHSKPKHPPHGRTIASGANSVLINGKPAANIGSAISCGGSVIIGSADVIVGDSPKPIKPIPVKLESITFPNQYGNTASYTPNSTQENILSFEEPVMYFFEPALHPQDRHAQCNIQSAQTGAPFVKGSALTSTEKA